MTTATPNFSRQITDHEVDVEQVRETERDRNRDKERETERIKGIFRE